MKKVKINGRWDIILPDHRADRPEWTQPEGWEKARLDSMNEHLSDKDTLFYVGAEEGDMAALCAMWIKKIVLFEPNSKVWPNIKAIWESNQIQTDTWTFEGFAGENMVNPVVNHGFPVSADGELISDHGFKELHEAGDISQITIDSVSSMVEPPTAISLDVEGSEWRVLKGAQETLKKYHPRLWISIHPEFMFRIYGEYQFDLRRWIKDFGYKEQILDYQHELHIYYE